jgi:RNA polymerase sigma-70 factor (ECF subfamily)
MVKGKLFEIPSTQLSSTILTFMPIDPNNLEKLLDRYWPVLVQWVGGAHDGAEDIVQAAFIKLAVEEPQPTNCVAWLFTVTKRLAINERLSQSKRRSRESHAVLHRTVSMDLSQEMELRDLLNTLEEREREVLIARLWGDLTFDQIGSVFRESKASIWRTYQSGLLKLREAYRESSDE